MVRTKTADDESLEQFADYVNARSGNFRARVDDRRIHDGTDCVVVSTGSTSRPTRVLSIVQGAGWQIKDVSSDGDTYDVVAVPPEVGEWVFDVDAAQAADFGIEAADDPLHD
jgi:hypothetical protein